MTADDRETAASPALSKGAAQRRADRIAAFDAELAELERAGVLALPPEQRAAVAAHHASVRRALGEQHDVDFSEGARRLSLGMQIVSFLGAGALAASVFFLFYQYWGYLGTGAQVAILVAAPIAALLAAFWIRRRESTGYFAKLAALIAFACFVLDITMLGQIFNITPSHGALILFAAYALVLAYSLSVRLLLAAAIFSLFAFIGAEVGSWSGMYWLSVGERPESFIPPALALFAVPSLVDQARYHGFATIYRVLSMIGFFVVILVMCNWGDASYVGWDAGLVEGLYEVAGFGLSALAVWWGMRRGLVDVMTTGNVFFALFLFTKFFDWWWDWMPKYVFFLVVGLTAVLALLVFQRLRALQQRESAP